MRGRLIAFAALGTLFLMETRRPLRRQRYPRLTREVRNFAMAAGSGAVVQYLERPLLQRVCRTVKRAHWGLLPHLRLSDRSRTILGIALMDYTLYVWHILTHRSRLLWRLHQVHHADLDLDASTALRFHALEMLASIPFRVAQVCLLGIDARTLQLWQGFLFSCILFHHSNLRLPERFERLVGQIFMTPRLHGIHHSVVERERHTNWSSGLTLWDRLHGTLKTDVRQSDIEIGLARYRHPDQVTFAKLLLMPLRER
ncbi:MAG: sterol desaturase family protein [Sinobacteraceae bacterium]|nr:sterol desaturase family protein [Nevskiaceae bacterium]